VFWALRNRIKLVSECCRRKEKKEKLKLIVKLNNITYILLVADASQYILINLQTSLLVALRESFFDFDK